MREALGSIPAPKKKRQKKKKILKTLKGPDWGIKTDPGTSKQNLQNQTSEPCSFKRFSYKYKETSGSTRFLILDF
jgi:hypothetical protein